MNAIDGVSKVFLVKHELNAMHFEGFNSEREMVEQLLYRADWGHNDYSTENQVEWLRGLHAKVDETIKAHLKPEPQSDDGSED